MITIWWRWGERVRKSPRFSWRRIVSKMETRVTENEMVEFVRFRFLDGFGHCLSAVRHEVALGQKIVEIDSIILRIVIMSIVASALCCAQIKFECNHGNNNNNNNNNIVQFLFRS